MSQTGQIAINYGRNPSDVLRHYTELEIAQSGGSQNHFAQLLAANYHDLVPENKRTITGFSDWRATTKQDELNRLRDNNKKQLNRYMNGMNIPLELLSAWINTLDHYRLSAMNEISSQCGFVPASIVSRNQYENMTQLMRGFGDFVDSMAPIMRDSVIDELDAPFVPEAVAEVEKLISVLHSLKDQMVQKTQQTDPLPLPEVSYTNGNERVDVIGVGE